MGILINKSPVVIYETLETPYICDCNWSGPTGNGYYLLEISFNAFTRNDMAQICNFLIKEFTLLVLSFNPVVALRCFMCSLGVSER